MPFLSPIFLSLTTLASVPIIIHLLNRRRFIRIDWAPMKYLKLTIKTNRQRLRIEQLILLAIRTLAVLLLMIAIARPVLSANSLNWLTGHGRTSRIIVIDDSLSMAYQTDHRSAFEGAHEVLTEIAGKIGSQDSVTALLTSDMQRPIVREVHLQDTTKLLGEFNRLSVTDVRSDWPATFKAIDGYLAAATFPTKEVTIITDFRKNGWGDAVKEIADRWAVAGVKLRIVDVGSKATANVSLAGFDLEDPLVLPGDAAKLRAAIRNDTPAAITGAQCVLTIGDQSRSILLPDLPPGQVTEVPLTVSAQKPGQFPLSLTLPADQLSNDNVRWLTMNVRSAIDVQLVDGLPSSEPFEGATDFLNLAFSIGAQPWRIDKRSDQDWSIAPLQAADVMVLADVASLSPQRIAAVERMVSDGMGLMIFAGEQVDPVLYNQRLYRNGQGLLPVPLDKAIDSTATGLVVEQLDQSALSGLTKLVPAALARIKPRRFMGVDLPAHAENVRVLARWNDAPGHPAVIEKRFGKGRVIFWTVTANKEWSDWPIDPTYVLAVRSTATSIARADRQQDNLTVGQPIQFVMDEGQSATQATVTLPGHDTPDLATIDKPAQGPPIIRATQSSRAGAYTLNWKDSAGLARQHLFCVSPDSSESDLTPLPESELLGMLDHLHPDIVHYRPGQSVLAAGGRELWRSIAWTVFGLLMVETVMAVWVGRER